ncbi:hypothetical protein ACHAWF_000611 [Thalassiosira exigua]
MGLGMGLGMVKQATNGAALVVCGSILMNFVVPKLLKMQKYVVCPFIDMANHVGVGATRNVAFKYFADGFSLFFLKGASQGEEVFIRYGPQNNNHLLQYYGFVEEDNVHDMSILPPIREWDLGALEEACGRKVGPGRLEKLDRAGLLGRAASDVDADSEVANDIGGVVLTRAEGVDPAVIQALRALVSQTASGWTPATEVDPGDKQRTAARTAMELKLVGKAMTMEEDRNLLRVLEGKDPDQVLPMWFRFEKKNLLQEAIDKMQ